MTTPTTRAARNRRNALRSTGPKTAAGKAAVAGNARRHGVTAEPAPGDVSSWLSIIYGTHDLPRDAAMPEDDAGRAALSLARAEAVLAASEAALMEEVTRDDDTEGAPRGPRVRLLRRYASEARSRRRRALGHWLSLTSKGAAS